MVTSSGFEVASGRRAFILVRAQGPNTPGTCTGVQHGLPEGARSSSSGWESRMYAQWMLRTLCTWKFT